MKTDLNAISKYPFMGNLHSIETTGFVDGPGIRTIFFMQGCPLKCKYCHNPDSQNFIHLKTITTEEIVAITDRYKSYYDASGGGVTFSGGEPLMQGGFLLQTLKVLKDKGISTCIDTSGYGVSTFYDEILNVTDYILLDIKAMTDEAHVSLTGKNRDGIRDFMAHLVAFNGKIIIRHVMVPNLTDSQTKMNELVSLIAPIHNKVEKIEILPYHKNGIEKYHQLDLAYEFETVSEMNVEKATELETYANIQLKTIQLNSNEA